MHGRVQGVGFRLFVQRAAERLALVGWVRNLPDGRQVEFEAEGEAAAIEELLAQVRQGPRAARVGRVDVTRQEPRAAGEQGFTVR